MKRCRSLLLFAGLLATACQRADPDPSSATPETTQRQRFPRDRPSLMKSAPASIEEMDERYRLALDRRFLRAAEDIHVLLGRERPVVSSQRNAEGWAVVVGSQKIQLDGEMPSFPELGKMLSAIANGLGQGPNAPADSEIEQLRYQIEQFDATRLWPAIDQLESVWRDPSRRAAAVPLAARSFAYLAAQTPDFGALGDHLFGRALALWVLAEARRPEPEIGVLLAHSLGYTEDARRLSANLDRGSAVRAWAERRIETLTQLEATPICRFFRIEIGDRDSMPDDWSAGLVLSASMRSLSPTQVGAAAAAAESILRELPALLGAGALDQSAPYLPQFEAALESWISAAAPATLAPAEIRREYAQTLLASAIFSHVIHDRDRLGSAAAVEAFHSRLGTGSSPLTKQLSQWTEQMARRPTGIMHARKIWQSLAENRLVGGHLAAHLHWRVTPSFGSWDPERAESTVDVFARLDSRPIHRRLAANSANTATIDLATHDRLVRSGLEADPFGFSYGENVISLALADRDGARLREIAADPNRSENRRAAAAIALLRLADIDPTEFESLARRILAEEGENWELRKTLARRFEALGELERARKEVQAYLRSTRDGDAWDRDSAHHLLFDLAARQHDWSRAELELGQFGDRGRGAALYRAAYLLERTGRFDQAEAMIEQALELYPDGEDAVRCALGHYWRRERPDRAAEIALTSRPRFALAAYFWRTFAVQFLDSFGASDRESRAADAFRPVIAGCPPDEIRFLMWTPVLAIERGHKALAADLAKLVHAVVPPNDWEVRLEVYATLRESLGVEAALKWAETGLTQGDVWAESNIYASGGFLSSRATPELLFRFLKFAEDDENADVARACRARAIAEGYPISAEERTRLEKDIAVDDRIYHRIARYYLGLTPEAELVSGAKTPFERSATAAAIGRMRIRDRRYADASRHLRYAIEVGSLFNVERIESYTPLLAWDWTGQTLTSLERVGAAPLVDTESPLVIFSSI